MTSAEQYADSAFMALSDPTRRAILGRLAQGERTVGELAEPFAMTHQAVSRHLKVLESAGLISRTKVRQTRLCRVEPEGFAPILDWIERNQQLWAGRHVRLAAHLARMRDETEEEDT